MPSVLSTVPTLVPSPTVTSVVVEIDQLLEILDWIGFSSEPDCRALCNNTFTTYEDLLSSREKYITERCEVFSHRMQTKGKIHFGGRRTKKLNSLSTGPKTL